VTKVSQFATAYTHTFGYDLGSGYTVNLTLDFGRAVAPSAVPAVSGQSGISACTLDPQTDLVIPVDATLLSTTQGFSTPLYLAFRGNSSNGFEVGTTSSGCVQWEGQDLFSMNWQSVAPGQKETFGFYIVAQGYFGPQYPQGEPDPVGTFIPYLSTSSNAQEDMDVYGTGPSTVDGTAGGTSDEGEEISVVR